MILHLSGFSATNTFTGALFVKGTNIGFEVHGNYDCTVQIRDYNLVSYLAEKQR